MSKSTLGTIAVFVLLAVLISLFGGDIKDGLLAGLVAAAITTASYNYFKKNQEKENE